MVKRCMECNRVVTKNARRGLCRVCYNNPDVREHYPTLARGAWKLGARAWTVFDDMQIRAMFEQGALDQDIASALNRNWWCVRRRRRHLGLKVSNEDRTVRRWGVPWHEDSARDISFIRRLRRW